MYGSSLRQEFKLSNLLKILREQIKTGIKIHLILIHDGVIDTSVKSKKSQYIEEFLTLPIEFYSITPDLKARGINPKDLPNRIKNIEYEDLVDILAEAPRIFSWM